MSDKPKKEPDAKAADAKGDAHAEKPKGGGLLSKTPVLLGGAMIIEAVVLFAGFKFLGGSPKPANAELMQPEAKAEGGKEAEAAKGEGGKEGEHGKEGEGKPGAEGAAKPAKMGARVEISVLEFRAPNSQNGRTFLYDVSIFITVKSEKEAEVKEKITASGALIKDRVRTIIAQSDPAKLGAGTEPGLETLRRQVKYQLDSIVGEGIVEEVLVPRCIPTPVSF